MPKYSETHHLNVDDAGLASVHVAVHLQDADPRIARLLVLRVLDAAAAVADAPEQGILGQVVRPQTSGPCVHYDEQTEYAADADPCTYPYGDGTCPHLDNPDVLCPVKDACYAMREVARMRDACEAEQGHRDADAATREPVYETAAPERVEPAPDDGAPHTYTVPVHEEEPPQDGAPPYAIRLPPPAKRKNAWTEEENWTVARVDGRGDVIKIYRAAFPDSARTDKAIVSRWEKLHRDCREPLTLDTVGDTALVTQCDEDPVFTVPHPTYRPGDRVRIKHALHRGQTGKIERYFPATENYLVAIDGMPDMIVLRDEEMEAV